ncbi:hypothetical protein ASPWEDRAFT_101458 [Aspergillus wentii DTO 134E9]|uniref:Regulator of volume decrease after cellular swelling-domain-containing protein n=1 Tax=Aspergillus wentii DTO 134E9 TaxID=1073089 RepID=A0A1L9S3J3_ASPWE|nr:uncharacterized protein ASPWEDRAFT_101458 [Aspergillus wentii DTO 134E9]KAI9930055.1 hypothetical protein MW887_011865 [Aspergillus wentii]OJJ41718.1 hypothetical protein ASPWEDRAFT_101458 [Aspergillus wentii DTO 134E9]
MEPLHAAPETASFVLLAEHQSRTPSSFHSGPPVLHYHNKQCKVVILERDILANPPLNAIRGAAANGSGAATEEAEEKEIAIDGVDVWVTSDKFLLYAPAASAGISIPYPSISLHAIQRLRLPDSPDHPEVQGLYMQIAAPSGAAQEDDVEECITMTVVPPAETEMTDEDKPEETPTQMFYGAVSACSNLHPDPVEQGDEDEDEEGSSLFQNGLVSAGNADGGLPPPAEGSSGWITADNMHEFIDEEGNWIAGGEPPSLPLGPGAGTVRHWDEDGGNEGRNGEGEDQEDETKWRRTD